MTDVYPTKPRTIIGRATFIAALIVAAFVTSVFLYVSTVNQPLSDIVSQPHGAEVIDDKKIDNAGWVVLPELRKVECEVPRDDDKNQLRGFTCDWTTLTDIDTVDTFATRTNFETAFELTGAWSDEDIFRYMVTHHREGAVPNYERHYQNDGWTNMPKFCDVRQFAITEEDC